MVYSKENVTEGAMADSEKMSEYARLTQLLEIGILKAWWVPKGAQRD